MKLEQRNRFVRFILRAIDVFVGFYMPRVIRWDKEPFRKATGWERRFGGLFMACLPALSLAFMAGQKHFGNGIDSIIYGHNSIVWLYVGFFVLVGGIGAFLLVIGPKTPLAVSIPVAVLMWATLAWYAWKDCFI